MKKVLALILALCMVVALCACGQSAAPAATEEPAAADAPAAEAPAEAEAWAPSEPITLIVPFGAGGQTDLVSRAIAQAVEEVTGWTIVVENVTGSGGMVGAAQACAADSDGLTWLASSIGLVVNPLLGTAPDGVSYTNLENIAMVCSNPGCISVAESSPYTPIQEFIDAAKAAPATVSIANGGAGGSYHLMALSIQNKAGVEFLHVPYSDGTSAAVVAAVGGHNDAVVSSPGEVSSQVAAGQMRILAVAADERYSACPDVPTFKECGIDVSMATFAGIALPKGTPENICKAVEEAVLKAAQQESFTSFMNKSGYGIDVRGSEAIMTMLNEQNDLYSGVVGLLG